MCTFRNFWREKIQKIFNVYITCNENVLIALFPTQIIIEIEVVEVMVWGEIFGIVGDVDG